MYNKNILVTIIILREPQGFLCSLCDIPRNNIIKNIVFNKSFIKSDSAYFRFFFVSCNVINLINLRLGNIRYLPEL